MCRIPWRIRKIARGGHFRGNAHSTIGGNEQFLAQKHRIHIAPSRWPINCSRFLSIIGVPRFPKYTIRASRQLTIPHTRTVSVPSFFPYQFHTQIHLHPSAHRLQSSFVTHQQLFFNFNLQFPFVRALAVQHICHLPFFIVYARCVDDAIQHPT